MRYLGVEMRVEMVEMVEMVGRGGCVQPSDTEGVM
jgi:hypothetical protein